MWSSSPPSTAFHFHPAAFRWRKKWHFSFLFMLLHYLIPLSSLIVCSSAPVGMKIQPLNQTALMVSWEPPLTVYHPPITSYMVSYSWVKRDVADEKTFTKTGDQSMVSSIINCHHQLSSRMWSKQLWLVCRAPDVSGGIRGWLDQWQCV